VETGGLLVVSDLLVDARRAYRRESIVAGQWRAKAAGHSLVLQSGKGVRESGRIGPAKVLRIRAELIAA
jgi:hypothetical protein